jgi:hypothetical protein
LDEELFTFTVSPTLPRPSYANSSDASSFYNSAKNPGLTKALDMETFMNDSNIESSDENYNDPEVSVVFDSMPNYRQGGSHYETYQNLDQNQIFEMGGFEKNTQLGGSKDYAPISQSHLIRAKAYSDFSSASSF